jgi:hypothetical protein
MRDDHRGILATTSWLFGTFGESQLMAQSAARRLFVSPLIIKDFRMHSPLFAGGNFALASLNHQK